MKVYIYYLTIPDSPSEKYSLEDLSRFDIVIKQLSDNHFKKKPGVVITINGTTRYLYAFTNNKEYTKDFEFIHNMLLFTKLERKMDREEYEMFKNEMEHAELLYFKVEGNREQQMLLTKLENSILEDSFYEVETHLSTYACLGYEYLKRKYIIPLDILLYTVYYQLNGPDSEFYSHNWSYGVTPENASEYGVSPCLNFPNMYFDIFKLILK